MGLYVPREQLSGYLLFSPHRVFSVGVSYEAGFAASISPRIRSTVYPYVYLSWELRVTDWLHIGATVFQPLYFDPVIYAPIFGVNIRLTHLAAERTTWKGPPPTPVPVTPFR